MTLIGSAILTVINMFYITEILGLVRTAAAWQAAPSVNVYKNISITFRIIQKTSR